MAGRPDKLLQTKLFTVLTGDATLRTKLSATVDKPKVFDQGNVPDGQKTPFIVIGDIALEHDGSFTHSGFKGLVQIDTWDERKGKKFSQELVDRIYALLHRIDLALTGFETIAFFCESADVTLDDDKTTYHGVLKFRVLLGGN